MYDSMHTKISVVADFPGGGKVEIKHFTWEGKKYEVEKTHLITKAHRGRETVWLFHISTQNAAFKLRLDTDSLIWYLEELTWDKEVDGE
ncbi:hypothetical protein KC640_00060 [Candidatus Dojkabacteria bacterium]|uniref:Uncharacterized protein n=1 Tax=Candidatus Dojkabacteria bacterium TaxID=2099670 RepID=A0A955KZ31_9BACT|nr:hypothetical protein [Candidatus Dojkabacteria bacterium]